MSEEASAFFQTRSGRIGRDYGGGRGASHLGAVGHAVFGASAHPTFPGPPVSAHPWGTFRDSPDSPHPAHLPSRDLPMKRFQTRARISHRDPLSCVSVDGPFSEGCSSGVTGEEAGQVPPRTALHRRQVGLRQQEMGEAGSRGGYSDVLWGKGSVS